jgi:hypothetical protein
MIMVFLVACSQATEAPADVEFESDYKQEEAAPPETVATAQPTPSLVPEPTQPAPGTLPTPTLFVEARMIELEWPPRMRLGDSDTVRLALVPTDEGYIVTTEFPDHQTDTQDISVARPGGYDLNAIARLDGVGFQISPASEQVRFLPVSEPVTWHWSLKPTAPGQQRLTMTLLLRWSPQASVPGSPVEAVAYSKGMDVQVSSFFGLTRAQAMTGGLFGLIIGAGISFIALTSLVLPIRSSLKSPPPSPTLVIEPHPGLSISRQEDALLRTLFRRYARLVLEREFLSGYSGARTILAQPIQRDGRADAHTIVKIGPRDAILREHQNYETYVKDTLPPVTARIQRPPVTVRGGKDAALQYTFIAEPGNMPISLRQALLDDPDPSMLYKLFDTFGPNWWMQRRPYTFRLAQEYDRMLSTHYVIEPAPGRGDPLDGRTPPDVVDFGLGNFVRLRNFPHSERRADGRSLSLRGTAAPGHPPLRLRWLSLKDPNGASGQIVATRKTFLDETVSGFDLFGLPDPRIHLAELMDENVSGTQSTIHGDLNVENVLTGPGDFVWLIDFSATRDGHPLFDFAHLEAEIIAHVIAPQVKSPQEYLSALGDPPSPFDPSAESPAPYALLNALHNIASRCLFNVSQPREYYLALYMCCMGALKFANLEPYQKHLLYLTAAYLVQDL